MFPDAAGTLARLGVVLPICLATIAKASVHPLDFQEYILEHIWGRCAVSPLTPDGVGCHLDGADTCSDRLSEGPGDADVEVILGNLPPSTSSLPVHLHFWAPYESLSEYDPLQGPNNVSIYVGSENAFPKYYDPEFNGGNVQVNQSGFTTIRVRSPASYVFKLSGEWKFMPVKVHLRVCKGENIILHPDTLFFDLSSHTGQPEIWVKTKSQASHIEVIEARPYATPIASSIQYNVPPHVATLKITITPKDQSDVGGASATTSTAAESLGEQHEELVDQTDDQLAGTDDQSGEATHLTVHDTLGGSPDDSLDLSSMEINSAREQLDLDALSFSPIYACFQSNKFFSHFLEGCVDSCEPGHSSAHGQCVRQEVLDELESFWTRWDLEVQCEGACGEASRQETLHRIRLEAGMLLDVPFQEVDVAMVWEQATSRRLAATARVVVLEVTASTKRLEPLQGKTLLDQLIANVVDAGRLLQLPVLSFQDTSSEGQVVSDSENAVTSDEDSYETAYELAMPTLDLDESGQQETKADSSLSIGIIISVAAAVVVVGGACGIVVFCAQHRAQRRHRELEPVDGVYVGNPVDARDTSGGKTAGKVDDVAPVPATEIGNPTAEEGSGAGALSSV